MKKEEVTKWLKIMKANLNTFPEVSSEKKIKALAEAIRLLKNEQSQEPRGSITKNDLGIDAVSRKAVINQIFYSTDNSGDVVLGSALRERIEKLPSITPIRPKGHWCPQNDDYFDWYECSECGYGSEAKCNTVAKLM